MVHCFGGSAVHVRVLNFLQKLLVAFANSAAAWVDVGAPVPAFFASALRRLGRETAMDVLAEQTIVLDC